MEELLAGLFAVAVQLSGMPGFDERPSVTAMPYRAMLLEVCADLREESPQLLAGYDRCPGPAGAGDCTPPPSPEQRRYERCIRQSGLVAAYITAQHRIVHRDDLDIGNDIDNSFIVHEFVHALQDRLHQGRMFETCEGVMAAERQAYAVQERYLRSRGQMLQFGARLRTVGCQGMR